ncbi:MAG: ATP-binding protein, partial [Lachnospiraceae bacterium]|nr:ATP-binding protein [Lachnospiraceae bacterium]
DGRYALIEIKTGTNRIPEAEKSLLKFKDIIKKHNQAAEANTEHPKPLYREPSALIVICANATMAYTTENGVKVIPVGCLKD